MFIEVIDSEYRDVLSDYLSKNNINVEELVKSNKDKILITYKKSNFEKIVKLLAFYISSIQYYKLLSIHIKKVFEDKNLECIMSDIIKMNINKNSCENYYYYFLTYINLKEYLKTSNSIEIEAFTDFTLNGFRREIDGLINNYGIENLYSDSLYCLENEEKNIEKENEELFINEEKLLINNDQNFINNYLQIVGMCEELIRKKKEMNVEKNIDLGKVIIKDGYLKIYNNNNNEITNDYIKEQTGFEFFYTKETRNKNDMYLFNIYFFGFFLSLFNIKELKFHKNIDFKTMIFIINLISISFKNKMISIQKIELFCDFEV